MKNRAEWPYVGHQYVECEGHRPPPNDATPRIGVLSRLHPSTACDRYNVVIPSNGRSFHTLFHIAKLAPSSNFQFIHTYLLRC